MRLVVALAIGVVGAESAAAQESPEARDIVVVTGIGPARTSDELIANTTVLDSDDIVERLSGGLGDTLSGLPGVASTSFGPGASRPIIRGLGAERVQVLTNGIGVIDASAASPDHAVTADPLGVERIEILRGPAALAYGGGATGGVINVIDGLIVEELPEKAFSAMAYAALTSVDDGKQLAGRVTGVAGPVAGVLSGSWLDADSIDIPGFALSDAARAEEIAGGGPGEPFASGTLPNSAVENKSVSAGLSWVGDSAFVGAAVRRLDSTYGIVGEVGPFIDLNQTRYDVRGGLRFDGLISEITATGSVVDYDHTEFEDVGEPGTAFTNEGWEARVEARHRSIGGFEGSFGVQASDRDFEAIGEEAFVTPTQTEQVGIFLYEAYEQDRWGFEGGIRVDDVQLDNLIAGERSFDTLNASVGAHTHLNDQIFVGASIARTERAPTDIELFANGPHLATGQFEVGDDTIDTETGLALEGTMRWEGAQAFVDVSVFRYDFDGFIYLVDTGGVEPGEEGDLPIFQFTQSDAVFTGLEISGGVEWGQMAGIDWRSDASFDYVRAELDGGGNVPLIPPARLLVGLEGEREGISGRVEAQYAAKQDEVASFETETDDFLVFNASVGIDVTENFRLLLEGRNLSDEEVRLHSSVLKEVAPQPGRNFRVAVRAKF